MSDQNLPPGTPVVSPPAPPQDDRVVSPQPLANSLVQTVATTPPPQPEPQRPSQKEKAIGSQETIPTIEVTGTDAIEKEPIPPEVESWMEKVGQDEASLKQQIEATTKQSVASGPPPTTQKTVFILPLGELNVNKGSRASVNDSIKWLATWCMRILKKLGPAAAYRQQGK